MSPSHGPINCLIVDDYSHNRDLHKLLLEREGAQVTLANNGREAIEKYKRENEGYFNFIMMDILMPEVDGFTAAKMIREWEASKGRKPIDIYFVSGEYFNEEEVMVGFKARMAGSEVPGIKCLRKPIEIDQIKRVVKNYLGEGRRSSSEH